ncbi:hypothetical protein BJ322DRAFT_1101483 [Thelephora terrestris]|uniref:Transcription elongation regulator 1 n=1 Tax=Thelephora terrestris TaxID=56493 RepID=A0A9P6H5S9_9AGAM|nr:hypothetical protein BJ322DRAFT_1101483 [Thelephora terrestris]
MATPLPGQVPVGPPPLPLGWTEHVGPGGQPYYFNIHTSESTYVRPLPTFPMMNPAVAAFDPVVKPVKDKPLVKTPIPGTDWIRVKTTQGNTFYSHKVEKRSMWVIPEDIREAVEALEKDEQDAAETLIREQEEEAARVETERVKAQIAKETAKRKAQDPVPVDEVVISKKARVDNQPEDEEMDEEDEDSDDDEDEEEEWQKEAAAQLAAEAEEHERQKKEEEEAEQKRIKDEETLKEEYKTNQLNMPAKVDLAPEEAKALFKTLLREKDVNPLHPWDKSLPLFISDPRYVLLSSVSARREVFDEYCRERSRELRQSKVAKEKENPKEEFEKLLNQEVKSTRTSWTEFRRQWKKDRRFYGWGRDEREREKRFREFLKELGEKKRAAAQKAEMDFFALLRENNVDEKSRWKDFKRKISSDSRYEAVGSSSLREELFNTFLKANAGGPATSYPAVSSSQSLEKQAEEEPGDGERTKEEKRERALRERAQKVRADQLKVEAQIGRSRAGLNKEEDERDFRSLLTDAVRDPQVTWDSILPQLETDPRFTRSTLPLNHKLHIFHDHVGKLRHKHIQSLHALFGSHTPNLATTFSALPVDTLLSSLPATKLGFRKRDLEHEFERWQRERNTEARMAFDEMMGENSFIEFWGRLGKIGGAGVDSSIQNDDIGEEEGEGEERVDMKKLAKGVDVKEILKVLKNDKRYISFDHVPEQRERWIRDYVGNMKAPQLSVHVPEKS